MALTRLPTELLDLIISDVVPEGLESLALTCRRIHVLCRPFFQRHHELRAQFQNFSFYLQDTDPAGSNRSTFDLIARIAVEPVVARYIRNADFAVDSYFLLRRPYEYVWAKQGARCNELVLRLLADSPYLKQAGLDFEDYASQINADLEASRYSQYAAAFALTLLPNVQKLTLPRKWKVLDVTDKLVDAIVHKAAQSQLPGDWPSLAQTTTFGSRKRPVPGAQLGFDWASPFLALPQVRSFEARNATVVDNGRKRISSKEPRRAFGETLETVHFMTCYIDEVGIADFLKHTPRLRKLEHSHSTTRGGSPQYWNVCSFIRATEREAGSHLEELTIYIRNPRDAISPGQASMRGFQRLRKLEFSLELASCNMNAAADRLGTPNESVPGESMNRELDACGSCICDLAPASVSLISLISRGTDDHEKVLNVLFRHFAAKKDSHLPALEEVHLSGHSFGNPHEDQCAWLFAETKKAGVVLHQHPFSQPI